VGGGTWGKERAQWAFWGWRLVGGGIQDDQDLHDLGYRILERKQKGEKEERYATKRRVEKGAGVDPSN